MVTLQNHRDSYGGGAGGLHFEATDAGRGVPRNREANPAENQLKTVIGGAFLPYKGLDLGFLKSFRQIGFCDLDGVCPQAIRISIAPM